MTRHASRLSTGTALALCIALPAAAQEFTWGERNTGFEPAFPEQFRAELQNSEVEVERTLIAGGLEHPWGIEILPGKTGYLVTERPGRLRHIARDGTVSDPISGLPEVAAIKQGGLLDIALAPDFDESRMIYWSYAKEVTSGNYATAVGRGTLTEDLTEVTGAEDIFVQEPAVPAPMHYGSRVVFDDAGHVFITTGEHFTQEYRTYAQGLDNTFGKVVRVAMDGSVPQDNPFVGQEGAMGAIWSYGHRNIQGALMLDGTLWTIEHGPKGGDELNMPEAGKNYGWPTVSYGEQYSGQPIGSGIASAEGMEQPVYFWDPVIAPGGMTVYEGDAFADWEGDLLISSLKPGGLVRLELSDGRVVAEERLARDAGRVRDVAIDRDGSILFVTDLSNGGLMRMAPKSQGS